MSYVSPIREPLVTGGLTYNDVTESVLKPLEAKPNKLWLMALGLSSLALAIGLFCITYTLFVGIGAWGLNKTVGWAFDITDFVFWIGIGHAGTLISAILLLFRQQWRNSINRAAEAMTIFAVLCAAIFPLIHMGRPWVGAFWVLPLPNTRGSLWVNFNSPLLWDVFAISTYFSVSLVFWFLGLIPDLATVRDRAKNWIPKAVYGALSLGWNGSAKTWYRFELVSLVLAGISTPLVLSVHTIVSFDFATSVIPGWHTTIFPPYFVAGAIFSGFGMVQTLLVVTRKMYKLENVITLGHMEAMAKIVILTGSLVGIAYGTEFFIAWYSGNHFEKFTFINRAFGPMWWSYWIMLTCNVVTPQLFWFKSIRTSMTATFIISLFINVGMWFERFVIIVTSLYRDYLPSSWVSYTPTWIEIGILFGTFGLFFTLFFLFAKVLPVVNMFEVKTLIPGPDSKHHTTAHEHH
jgi:Ni/Fe-hydrogenase subunit HybB-like protein